MGKVLAHPRFFRYISIQVDHGVWRIISKSTLREKAKEMMATTAEQSVKEHGPLRAITPRRGLPSARALLGAFLVTAAALGTFALTTGGDEEPSTSYLVLQTDVPAGGAITLGDVEFVPMELGPSLVSTALTTTAGLDGATALRDLRGGELVSTNDLLAAPSIDGVTIGAVHELTFGVPLDRTPPGLRRGDRVTVLGTTNAETAVGVEDAVVLVIDTEPGQIGSSGQGVLTLAMDDAETVLVLTHLTQTSDLTIVRSTRAIDDVYPESTRTADALNSDLVGDGSSGDE
jgi:hypothetical protein